MARNKSEKSPSGDPQIDEYLRAWLRWHRSRGGLDRSPDSLWYKWQQKRQAITHKQFERMRVLGPNRVTLGPADIIALYGHEPEFQDGTQQK